MEHAVQLKFDKLFLSALITYFVLSTISIFIAGLAVFWFVTSQYQVVDWIDPDGPGFRVLEVSKDHIDVKWIQIKRTVNCPGTTDISLIGERLIKHLETYPLIVSTERMDFERAYQLPPGLKPGDYEIVITDTAKCNPLFGNRQILKVPFSYPLDFSTSR